MPGRKVSRDGPAWMKGALLLTAAAVFVKGLSALYKIPYQNITGDLGFYVYQQIYPLYGAAFVIGTFGFPLMLAKWTAGKQEAAAPDAGRLRFFFWALVVLHTVVAAAVTVFAPAVAALIGDPSLSPALRFMGLPFMLIPFLAFGRGWFQGRGDALPSALSQVAEQSVRVVMILLVASFAMYVSGNPYYAGISAGAGALAGGTAGSIFLFRRYRRDPAAVTLNPFAVGSGPLFPEGWFKDTRIFLVSGFYVSASAMALILFQAADALTVIPALTADGMAPEAAGEVKGVYDRSWPLVQFGAVVTTVFSYGAVPSVVRSFANGDNKAVREETARAVKIAAVFGSAAAIGMAAVMPALNPMMFTDRNGTELLMVMSSVVLSGSIFMTAAALLHALDRAREAALWLGAALIVKTVFTFIAVSFWGIAGAAFASALVFLCLAAAVLSVLIKHGWLPLPGWKTSGRLAAALGLMAAAAAAIRTSADGLLAAERAASAAGALTASAGGALLFILLIWRFKVFSADEWEQLPKLGRWLPYPEKHD
ncbi:polysaccharide biosynthesis protein [Salisediminibacterium halotolerans]|uniref:Polysaccharide transporter, PST family n=1 Tax=Salisediminibacterium halotolerans TaxID=517425 RepID=A0A1H9VSB1_9BACI|nr:polysaccharide biosynthesis protein [Salisediminibacterium haloalkalitolerans]SES24429.1 polysaccharide transporter, PST family [Salisediminibacterium haloalkalitolerans]